MPRTGQHSVEKAKRPLPKGGLLVDMNAALKNYIRPEWAAQHYGCPSFLLMAYLQDTVPETSFPVDESA